NSTRRGQAYGKTQPCRRFSKHASELLLDCLSRHPLNQSQLDRLQKVATLTRKVRDDFAQSIFCVGSGLGLDRVLELRPETAQMGLEQLNRILHLRLDRL